MRTTFLLCLVSAITAIARADELDDISVDVVANVWNERQTETVTFHFKAVGTQFEEGGPRGLGRGSRAREEVPNRTPPEATTHKIEIEYAHDERGRLCFIYDGQTWSHEMQAQVDFKCINIFDDGVRTTYFPYGNVEFPSAHIRNSGPSDVGRNERVCPINLLYRPFDSNLGELLVDRLVLKEDRVVLDGRICLILFQKNDLIDVEVWIDPSRDYVPLRYTETLRGVLHREVHISYKNDDRHGWVPTQWINSRFTSDGRHSCTYNVDVISYSINTPIPEATFTLEYPPGTWIRNYITGERFLLREQGGRRPILPGEFDGANYQELLESEPASSVVGLSRFWLIVFINVGVLATVVAVVVYKWRTRRNRV